MKDVVVVVFSHQLLSEILSPWSHKGAGALGRSEKPSEIKIRPGNTTLTRLKTHDTEKGEQVKGSHVQTELTWPRLSTQLQHRVPPSPRLTNSRLQTTAVVLPAPYEPHGNREYKRTPSAVWSAVRATTRGHAVKQEQCNQKPQCRYQ